MDASLRQAVDASSLRQFLAIRIVLSDGYRMNLIDGSGFVSFPVDGTVEYFDGHDPTFGSLATASSLAETVATSAPTFGFTLMPPTPSAIGSLADPKHQGSSVRAWWGLVNEMTGAVIGTPEPLWIGRLDNVKTQLSEGSLVAEVATVSAFDRLFVAEEGARLTPVFHKSIWPGETGLDYNSAALQNPYWGQSGGKTAVVSGNGGDGGGRMGYDYS
jgi:hypothetical protein